MNGVDINDNVLGQPNALFIEEAIEEVQVLTSAISAEYGRFGGGVVNVITRSGGNAFSGAFRLNLTNPAWSRGDTLREITRHDAREQAVADLRGHERRPARPRQAVVLRRRPRRADHDAERVRPDRSAVHEPQREHSLRGEADRDAAQRSHHPGHRSSTTPPTWCSRRCPWQHRSAYVHDARRRPTGCWRASWRGVLGSRTFATAQYSQKSWKLQNAGGSSTAVVDSPFMTRGTLGVPGGLLYNAPYFDSTDPEQRNNRQLTAALSHLLSSSRLGTHEVKGGFEHFVSTRVGGNSQTSTGYVFQTDYKLDANNRPALDADGRLIPRFVPNNSRVQVWLPQRGATIDIATTSLFATDHWTVSPRLTLDLGLRFESVGSEATGSIESIDATQHRAETRPRPTTSPATATRSCSAPTATTPASTTTCSSRGTPTSAMPIATPRNTSDQPERDAPSARASTRPTTLPISGTFPTANVFFDDDLTSPLTRELTLARRRASSAAVGRARPTSTATRLTSSRTSSPSTAARRSSIAMVCPASSTTAFTAIRSLRSAATRAWISSRPIGRGRTCP